MIESRARRHLINRSLSLRQLLLLTLLTLTVGGAAAIGALSYSAARTSLRREAIRVTGLAAESRRLSFVRTLQRQHERTEHMLAVIDRECPRALPPAPRAACARSTAKAFADIEGATSARLDFGSESLTVGDWHAAQVPPTQLIAIHRDADDVPKYVIEARVGDLVLALETPVRAIGHIFADRTGLGDHGEIFLVGSDGRPLTPLREQSLSAAHAHKPAIESCLGGTSTEVIDDDFGDDNLVHGIRYMPEMGGGCVMANVAEIEAFEPAARLGRRLLAVSIVVSLAGIFLSIVLADRIGAPIRTLHASARKLQSGDFDTALAPRGPSELRDLIAAFQAMARSLKLSHESLDAANRLKDEFLATLSHELRTPLNAIMGWTALLRAARNDPARVEHALDVIDRNARLQAQLVSDLLDMSRITTGGLRLRSDAVALADVVRGAIETVRPAADAKAVMLRADLADCLVVGEAGRLQQVVWNLLSNAVKFTPEGGEVTVTLDVRGAWVEIVVRDTGPGIAPEFLPFVFEPFRQADSSTARVHGGLGLGLAIARRIVELHGGRVRAESHSGGGASFLVQLPGAVRTTRVSTDTAVTLPPLTTDGVVAGALDGVCVLVLEDHADTRDLVVAALTEQGARAVTAASAAEAIAALDRECPDLLIADIGLPEEDGYSFIKRVRALDGPCRSVPALAFTAYVREEDRVSALAAGFDAHVGKPVASGALIDVVVSLLAARSAQGAQSAAIARPSPA